MLNLIKVIIKGRGLRRPRLARPFVGIVA